MLITLFGLVVALGTVGSVQQYRRMRAARRREARHVQLAMAALYRHRGWLNRTRAKLA